MLIAPGGQAQRVVIRENFTVVHQRTGLVTGYIQIDGIKPCQHIHGHRNPFGPAQAAVISGVDIQGAFIIKTLKSTNLPARRPEAYLIRMREKGGILTPFSLPQDGEMDRWMKVVLTKKWNKQVIQLAKEYPGMYRFLNANTAARPST